MPSAPPPDPMSCAIINELPIVRRTTGNVALQDGGGRLSGAVVGRGKRDERPSSPRSFDVPMSGIPLGPLGRPLPCATRERLAVGRPVVQCGGVEIRAV